MRKTILALSLEHIYPRPANPQEVEYRRNIMLVGMKMIQSGARYVPPQVVGS